MAAQPALSRAAAAAAVVLLACVCLPACDLAAGALSTTAAAFEVVSFDDVGNPREADLVAFIKDFKARGGFMHPNLRIKYRPNKRSDSRFRVESNGEAVGKDTEVVIIPKEMILHAHNAEDIAHTPAHVFDEGERLVLKIAEEDAKGEASPWFYYLRILPRVFHTPLWFNRLELEALSDARDSGERQQTGIHDSADDESFRDLSGSLLETTETDKPKSRKQIKKARRRKANAKKERERERIAQLEKTEWKPHSYVSQLAFAQMKQFELFTQKVERTYDMLLSQGDFEEGKASHVDVPADVAEEAALLRAGLTYDRLKWAWSVMTSRSYKVTPMVTGTHEHPLVGSPVLVPGGDFFDHDADAASNKLRISEGNRKGKGIELRLFAGERVPAGGVERVMGNYGNYSTADLVVNYGFAFDENEHDFVPVQLGKPEGEDQELWDAKLAFLDEFNMSSTLIINAMEGIGPVSSNTLRVLTRNYKPTNFMRAEFRKVNQMETKLESTGLEEANAMRLSIVAMRDFLDRFRHTAAWDRERIDEIEDEEDDELRASFNMELAIRARLAEKMIVGGVVLQTEDGYENHRIMGLQGSIATKDDEGRIITSDEEIFGQKRVTRQAADAVSEAKEATDGAEADADAGADDGADAGAEDSAEAGEAAEAAAEL